MFVTDDLNGWVKLAEAAARAAGALVQQKAAEPFGTMSKGFRDVVTDADFASQRLIVSMIRDHFPAHGILAEEKDPALGAGGQVLWVIDPIDGSSNFSRRVPTYCISLAAVADGQVQIGVIYDPLRDELYSAARGRGSTLNGAPLHVSRVEPLDAASIAFDWSRPERIRQRILATLGILAHRVHTLRTFGSAALVMAWVAAGRTDAYFNYSLGAWDIAAAGLIVAEAGGRTSSSDGRPFDISDKTTWAVTSNGLIHAEMLACLSDA